MYFSIYESMRQMYSFHREAVLAVLTLYLAALLFSYWKLFRKAGTNPLHALIPFWNEYRLFRLAWGDGYFCFFEFLPFVGFVFRWIMLYKLCQAFGKDDRRWIAAMLLLPAAARLVLAAGDASYIGPEGRDPAQNPYRD